LSSRYECIGSWQIIYHAIFRLTIFVIILDCDSDADCQLGLVCFFREAGTSDVPGCIGNANLINQGDDDFCILPPSPNTLVIRGDDTDDGTKFPAGAFPLGECEGDCDSGKRYKPEVLVGWNVHLNESLLFTTRSKTTTVRLAWNVSNATVTDQFQDVSVSAQLLSIIAMTDWKTISRLLMMALKPSRWICVREV
jgi:hypothetical protein